MELIDKYMWYQEGPGVRKNQYTSSGVKLLNVANLVEGKIELSTSSRYISEDEANGRYNHFLVDEGDLIIASSGIQVSYFEKKMGIAEKKHLPLCMNTSTIRFKVLDKNITDIRYFMYFLKSNVFKKQIRKLITGSAQLNFGPSHLKKIKIEMPELKKQQEIVKKLDRVKKIIDIRNNQIIELNELIKSQFVEMFGNIHFNDRKWNKNKWRDVLIIKNGKNQKKVESFNGKYPIYGSGGIIGFANDYICNENSIIIGRKGSINKPILVKTKFWNVDTAFGLEPIKEKIKADYLYYFCCFYNFEKHNKAVTIPSLTKKDLLNIEISVPPITLQNQFSEIVKQIDKQKFEIEKSLKETQELYESLMEKYFG